MPSRHLALLAAITVVSCAPSTLRPITFPAPVYVPVAGIEESASLTCAATGPIEVTDARADKTLGQRFLEENRGVRHPVTLTGDAAEWVRTGLSAAFARAGAAKVDAAGPRLRVAVNRIVTEEKVFRRAQYDGKVILAAELSSSTGGAPCWSGTVEGFAENYGYAGSADNYYETLNHALDRAAHKLISDADFAKHVCGACR